VDQNFREEALTDLAAATAIVRQSREERKALVDQLLQTEVRAPVAGVVHEMAVHTAGGVVSAGQAIMNLVPTGQPMAVSAHIAPDRVDEVHVGQMAVVRFSAFDRRTTPELQGTVQEVSADRVIDRATNAAFYPVKITISHDKLKELGQLTLVSGMPAEVFITTPSRSPLNYLLKPFMGQLDRTMKE
jgi:HlyD family secretion protein